MLPENKRFFILICIIGIVVIVLSVAARFVGSALWSPRPETEAALSLPTNEPGFPPVAAPHAAQPTKPIPFTAPHFTVEGKVPPEFQALETRLTAMEQTLSNRAGEKAALKKKMAEADGLILQAEGIAGYPKMGLSVSSSAPVKSENDKGRDTDMERLRKRLGALKEKTLKE